MHRPGPAPHELRTSIRSRSGTPSADTAPGRRTNSARRAAKHRAEPEARPRSKRSKPPAKTPYEPRSRPRSCHSTIKSGAYTIGAACCYLITTAQPLEHRTTRPRAETRAPTIAVAKTPAPRKFATADRRARALIPNWHEQSWIALALRLLREVTQNSSHRVGRAPRTRRVPTERPAALLARASRSRTALAYPPCAACGSGGSRGRTVTPVDLARRECRYRREQHSRFGPEVRTRRCRFAPRPRAWWYVQTVLRVALAVRLDQMRWRARAGLRFRSACRSPCPTRPTSRSRPVRPGNRGDT